MIFALVFLFILNGHVQFEKKSFPSAEECAMAGPKRQAELELNPQVDDIIFGACIPEAGQEVKK